MAVSPDQNRQASHRAPVAGAVQPVQDPIGAGDGEQLRELSAAEAATVFFREFDRIIRNKRVLESAQLSHGSDGVLRAPSRERDGAHESCHETEPRR